MSGCFFPVFFNKRGNNVSLIALPKFYGRKPAIVEMVMTNVWGSFLLGICDTLYNKVHIHRLIKRPAQMKLILSRVDTDTIHMSASTWKRTPQVVSPDQQRKARQFVVRLTHHRRKYRHHTTSSDWKAGSLKKQTYAWTKVSVRQFFTLGDFIKKDNPFGLDRTLELVLLICINFWADHKCLVLSCGLSETSQ